MSGKPTYENPEIDVDREAFWGEATEAGTEYEQETRENDRGLFERLFSGKTLAKAAIYETLDLFPVLAGYSAADVLNAVDGGVDLFHTFFEKDYSLSERAGLLAKGATKIGASAIPGVPAAVAGPAIDAIINVERK